AVVRRDADIARIRPRERRPHGGVPRLRRAGIDPRRTRRIVRHRHADRATGTDRRLHGAVPRVGRWQCAAQIGLVARSRCRSRSDAMIPLVHVSTGVAVALDAAAWASWSFVVGLVGARLTSTAVAHDSWLTPTRRFECDARCYEA